MVYWPYHNESLVRRGQVMMMDFDVIDDGGQEELERMNQDKVVGELYRYPDSFVQLLGYM
jgi:hypothetical protein